MEAQGHISKVPSSFIRSQTLPGHPGGLPDAPGGFPDALRGSRRPTRGSRRLPEAFQTLSEAPGGSSDAPGGSQRPPRRSRRLPEKYSVTRSSLTVLDASKANSRAEPFGRSGTHFQISRMLSTSVSEAWGKKRANALTHGANIHSDRFCPQACLKLGASIAPSFKPRLCTKSFALGRTGPIRSICF